MNRTRTAAAVLAVALSGVGVAGLAWAQDPAKPAATAQAPGSPAPVVTEARRREILQAARTLTAETFADVLRKAEAGDVEAQVLAGIALQDGNVVPKDFKAAARWVRAAEESGHPIAQNMMGNMNSFGTGMPRDPQKAVEWYTKAAAQGYAQAQRNLGWRYVQGQGVAANPVEGVRLFRLAAEQGNVDGQIALGWAYQVGKGVEKNPRETEAWYLKAAEQGDSAAQLDLGLAYERGEGVRKDKAEAERWYTKSSNQGNAIGSFQLGWLYLSKPGPGRTDALATYSAVKYLKLAAEQGYPVAAFVLGEVFSYKMFPYHVDKDYLEACSWYVVASNLDTQGDWETEQPGAIAQLRKDLPGRIDKVRKSLGGTQQGECDRRASAWLAAHPRGRQ